MQSVTIHDSGKAGDRVRVDSYGNGTAYNISFGEAGAPMRNLFFQGDDATALRDEFDQHENARPSMLTRDVWLAVLDPYL